MKRATRLASVSTALDVLLLLLCLQHLPSVFYRPAAPFQTVDLHGRVVIASVSDADAAGMIRAGDSLLEWNGMTIPLPEAVEFLGDQGTIGQVVNLTTEREGIRQNSEIRLVPFYDSPRFLIISTVVGLIIWGIALVILWNAPPGLTASILHWTMIAFAVTILITPGAISSNSLLSYVDRALFFLAYPGVVALFFYFTLLYPVQRLHPLFASLSLLPALLLSAGLATLHLLDLSTGSLTWFPAFQTLFDVFHGSLFLYTGGAVVSIGMALWRARRREERQRLQWIVWGLSLGAAPFLFLHILPQLLFSRYLMAEEYATIFFLAIPFSFSISFLKYHFLDIEVLINRSIVYGVLSMFVLITFSLMFFLVTSAVGTRLAFGEYVAIAAAALTFALLFAPARAMVQKLVDETLFVARANFRSAVRGLTTDLHHALTSDALFRALVDRLFRLIPVRSVGVYRLTNGEFRLSHWRGEKIPDRVPVSDEEKDQLGRRTLLTLPGAADFTNGTVKETERQWLERTGCTIGVPLTNEREELIGSVVLAPRTERDRFREEEIDLLQTGCAQAAEILEKLILQERMILEQEENRRLKELSDLKSYFVSSVSHELRTPLTAIRMFAETLRLGRFANRRQQTEYLKIIEGESGRLGRLIGNVLDFSKIERGVKEYNFETTRVRTVVRNAVAALQYEYRAAGGTLAVSVARTVPAEIVADADALQQLIINLLSNALKYSVGKKRARLSVRSDSSYLVIKVSDSGIGIPPHEIPLIFGKFHRVRDGRIRQVGGAGLGLPIVKHIVESHRGSILVESVVGKGSTFTVRIPIEVRR